MIGKFDYRYYDFGRYERLARPTAGFIHRGQYLLGRDRGSGFQIEGRLSRSTDADSDVVSPVVVSQCLFGADGQRYCRDRARRGLAGRCNPDHQDRWRSRREASSRHVRANLHAHRVLANTPELLLQEPLTRAMRYYGARNPRCGAVTEHEVVAKPVVIVATATRSGSMRYYGGQKSLMWREPAEN